MKTFLQRFLIYLFLLVAAGCSDSGRVSDTASPNAVLFDPTTSTIPLPNVLATATAADPFLNFSGQVMARPAGRPLNPIEALAYVNQFEMGGTNAVSGVNAPIYIRFTRAVDPSTVNASNIKVFKITADSSSLTATENNALGFTDITSLFDFNYTAGGTDLLLFPKFPLEPATRYVYVVTDRIRDAATGGNVISSVYFEALKSTIPLGGAFAELEQLRDNVYTDATRTSIKFSGYAKTMNDLIAASATTTVTSRNDIAILGRFVTTGAGFVLANANNPGTPIPVETALRSFAAGATLGGLPGKTWTNTVSGTTHVAPGAYYTALQAGTAPTSIADVTLGTIESADLSMDPVLVRANASTIDLTGVTGADNPAAGVLQAFRTGANLTGFYHVPRAIPFVYLTPATPNGKLVIFQHGITRQKEDVVAVAGTLTGQGFAVVAIDLPLHGALAVPGHTTGDEWGADFMALGAPLAARTNIQQGAFNLDRLELTFKTGGFGVPPTAIRFAGMSLGSIVGAYYLAGNTTLNTTDPLQPLYKQDTLDNDMKGLLSVPGARLAYLIKDSPSFGPSVDAGLAQKGVLTGTPTYQQFFLLTQTIIDPADPATMTTPLVAGLPSRLSGRLLVQEATSTSFSSAGAPLNGDMTITNPYTRYFGNALGGRGVIGTADALAVAPGFYQLTYADGSLPALFMYTRSGSGAVVPKTTAAASSVLATGPTEGYFEFNQADATHGFLIDPVHSPISIQLAQRQMAYFMTTGLAIDPTVQSPALPKIVITPAQGVTGKVAVPKVMKVLTH